jgi:5-carboxymethyl-2-hydroxymuconate isomerase
LAHAVVEYTDNLGPEADIPGLLAKIAKAMREADGVFPWGGIRVRAIKLTEYVIADGEDDYAMVNTTIKMGAGRPPEFKTAFFAALFEIKKAHFSSLYDKRYLALSMYVEELDESGAFRHNNLHAKFKKAAT